MQIPIGLEDQHKGLVDLVRMKAYFFDGDNGENVRVERCLPISWIWPKRSAKSSVTRLADVDDEIGEKFLMEEEISIRISTKPSAVPRFLSSSCLCYRALI